MTLKIKVGMSAARLVLALSVIVVPPGFGRSQTPAGDEGRPQVMAALRSTPLSIDGRLDEADWASAEAASPFVQGEPVEGAAVDQPTSVRVLFDGQALYVGARLHDAQPDQIRRQLSRRDESGAFDFFDVSLSPNNDRLTGYRFRVSAAGVQSDWYLYDDTRDDVSWDAVWESGVQHDAGGWTVEMRIPLSQLRFDPSDAAQTWGVNFSRRRVATNERSYLSLESRRQQGRVSVFGQLDGLLLRARPSRLEVRPYTLAQSRSAPAVAGNPFFDGHAVTSNAGLDLRAGVGAFTINATFNPDFGQVEVDPAVINLTAFETFFPERRPFFVQDARLLGFGLSGMQNGLFYTRRIGREPQVRSQSNASFVDVPSQSSIVGAAKMAGRTRGGLSLGALLSVSGQAEGRSYFTGADSMGAFVAEPRTVAAVVSGQQEFRRGASQMSGTVTMIDRALPASRALHHLPDRAVSAGVNFEHTWGNRRWAVTGLLAGSHVEGDSVALIRLQRSSNHYFQRPDATRFAVDSTETSMTGHEWRLQLEKRSGKHWTGAIWTGQRTAGFDVNDLGFSQGSERLDLGARVAYSEITPGTVFRSYRVNVFTFHNWRHEALDDVFSAGSWRRAYKRGSAWLNASGVFLNYWDVEVQARVNPTVQSDALTRGGPLMTDPGSAGFRLEVATDRRRRVSFRAEASRSPESRAGSDFTIESGVQVRPSPAVELSLAPRYQAQRDQRQYVTAVTDPAATETFGKRYVFADLERRSFSLETRVNVTFSPTLTLQLFAQPLLSTGDYLQYKTLERPRSFDFDALASGTAQQTAGGTVKCAGGRACVANGVQYLDFNGDGTPEASFAERDFRIRSLRGNAVLRWEYRPGSAIFVVWQQSRDYRDTDASGFGVSREFRDLFSAPAENVLIVKATYWLGL